MPFLNETPVTSVVIAGSGGFALEMYDYLEEEARRGGPAVAGFIDDVPGKVPEGASHPNLGRIADFRAEPGQVVLVAIGSVSGRRAVIQRLLDHGAPVPTYVHGSAIVSPHARLGMAAVVCPFSIVNRNAVIGEGALVGVHSSIAHGARVGAFAVLSPFAAINGDASVGAACFLGTRATIYPRISIGEECVVDTHAGVRANAGDRQMISSRGTYLVSALRIAP